LKKTSPPIGPTWAKAGLQIPGVPGEDPRSGRAEDQRRNLLSRKTCVKARRKQRGQGGAAGFVEFTEGKA